MVGRDSENVRLLFFLSLFLAFLAQLWDATQRRLDNEMLIKTKHCITCQSRLSHFSTQLFESLWFFGGWVGVETSWKYFYLWRNRELFSFSSLGEHSGKFQQRHLEESSFLAAFGLNVNSYPGGHCAKDQFTDIPSNLTISLMLLDQGHFW